MIFILLTCLIQASLTHFLHDQSLRNLKQEDEFRSKIEEIVFSTNKHSVLVFIHDRRSDSRMKQVISAVSNLSKIRPSEYFTDENRWSLENRPELQATSNTVLIYVYGTSNKLQSDNWEEIVDNLWLMWHESHAPDILFMLVQDGRAKDIETFFNFLWEKKILHVTIIEILPIDEYTESDIVIVHQYNPFTQNYTALNILDVVNFYPDKLKNMQGNTLFYYTTDDAYQTVDFSLLRQELLDCIQDVIHCELDYAENVSTADVILNKPFLLTQLEKDEEDLDYMVLISEQEVCLVTPILSANELTLWQVLAVIGLGCFIVFVFYSTTAMLNVSRHLRDPVTLMSIILGSSISRSPNTTTDRILFLCLVAISTKFTSLLYSEIFSLSVADHKILIRSYEELAETNLSVFVPDNIFSEIINLQDVPENLKERMISTSSDAIFLELLTGTLTSNTAYFIDKTSALLFDDILEAIKDRRVIVVTNLCFRGFSFLYSVPKRSPFKERLTEVLEYVIDTGHGYNFIQERRKAHTVRVSEFSTKASVDSASSEWALQFLMPLCFGHALAIIVFVTEVIAHKYWLK